MTGYNIIVIVTSLVLALVRINGVKGEIFQAIAHLFIGGVFVAALYSGLFVFWGIFSFLCVVDLGCFLADKTHRSSHDRLKDRLELADREAKRLEDMIVRNSQEHHNQVEILRRASVEIGQRMHAIEKHDILRRIEALEIKKNILPPAVWSPEELHQSGDNVVDSYPG